MRIVLADPEGSGLYGWVKSNDLTVTGSSITEGIGQSRVPGNLEGAPIDDAEKIPDAEALGYIYDVLIHEGLSVGTSAGINIAAAVRVAKAMGPGHTVVTILADGGVRYQSKLFNPEFLRSKSAAGAALDGLALGGGTAPDGKAGGKALPPGPLISGGSAFRHRLRPAIHLSTISSYPQRAVPGCRLLHGVVTETFAFAVFTRARRAPTARRDTTPAHQPHPRRARPGLTVHRVGVAGCKVTLLPLPLRAWAAKRTKVGGGVGAQDTCRSPWQTVPPQRGN